MTATQKQSFLSAAPSVSAGEETAKNMFISLHKKEKEWNEINQMIKSIS